MTIKDIEEAKESSGGQSAVDTSVEEALVDEEQPKHGTSSAVTGEDSTLMVSEEDANAVTTAARLANDHQVHDLNEGDDREFLDEWKSSPFAVGYSKPTWADEKVTCFKCLAAFGNASKPHLVYVYCLALICCCFPVGRVGNMFVLKQRMVEYDPDGDQEEEGTEQGRSKELRPKLQCVVGPYFGVTLTLTIPFLAGFSVYTVYRGIWGHNVHWAVILGWAFVTSIMFYSLFKTSCSNPGILYRQRTLPEAEEGQVEWRWNDQAQSYRPVNAKFDREVNAIVEEYDHTCPWLGTAIGRYNMASFKRFLLFMGFVVIYNIIILAFLS